MNNEFNKSRKSAVAINIIANALRKEATAADLKLGEPQQTLYIPHEAQDSSLAIKNSIFFKDINGHYSREVMINLLVSSIHFIDIRAFFRKSKDQAQRLKPASFVYKPHERFILNPTQSGVPELNVFNPPDWRRDEHFFNKPFEDIHEMPSAFDAFFRHLTDNDMDSYWALINWIAYSLVGKNQCYLVMVGGKGVGKSILGNNILHYLHGESNFSNLSNDTFKNRFNAEIENKTLGYLDELFIKKDSRLEISKLKLLTNNIVRVEKKGVDPFSCENYVNIYISSNDYEGIPLEANNRRLTIPTCTTEPLTDKKLIQEVTDPANIRRLGIYLLSRNTTFDEVSTPFVSSVSEDKIWDANSAEWEKWAHDWFLVHLPGLRKNGEVRIETFQEIFIKLNPNSSVKMIGSTRLERFLLENPSLGWRIKKHPSTSTGKSRRTFERVDPRVTA